MFLDSKRELENVLKEIFEELQCISNASQSEIPNVYKDASEFNLNVV
jgi:hypothetical protein